MRVQPLHSKCFAPNVSPVVFQPGNALGKSAGHDEPKEDGKKMKQMRVLQYLVGAIAVVLTMSITGPALAQDNTTVPVYRGQADTDSFFARGEDMSVDLGPGDGGPGEFGDSRVVTLYANGHGSASFEVYDANDALLGTVSGPLEFATDEPTSENLLPIVSVTFQRVTDGEHVCIQEDQTLRCSIVVPDPPACPADPDQRTITALRLVASVRGRIGLASIGAASVASAVDMTGNGLGEASFNCSISVQFPYCVPE